MTADKQPRSFTSEAFTTFLASEVKRTARYNRSLTLAYINVEGIDEVNQKFGPDSADRLLASVGDTIRKNLRESDGLNRLGFTEFGIILPETNQQQAQIIVPKVRQELITTVLRNQWNVTFKVGMVTCLGKNTFEAVTREADLLKNEMELADSGTISSRHTVSKEIETIKIIGINENMTHKVFGTRDKYNLFFRLSDYPPLKWEELFDEERKTSPLALWRNAWIQGRHLVVQCTLEEINQTQLNLIKQNISDTDKKLKATRRQQELDQLIAKKMDEEEAKRKHEALGSLVFE